MKLCDRCFKIGDYKPGAIEIKTNMHENFDVCESCYQKFIDFMDPKKEPDGNKRNNKPVRTAKKKSA